MSDPSHPTRNLADTSPLGSVLHYVPSRLYPASHKPNCLSSVNYQFTREYTLMSSRMAACIFCKIIKGV